MNSMGALAGENLILSSDASRHPDGRFTCTRLSGTISLVTEQEAAVDPLEPDSLSWREQAVARSLDSARLRAETRVQRFLDAAIELFNSGSGKDFTVQEVVDRSGQSLRSFYQYFGGKHELLLALFEESVRSTTDYLREQVSERRRSPRASPLLRRASTTGCAGRRRRVRSSMNGRAPFMAEFAQQLLTDHPKEAARVFAPLVTLFEEVLEGAESAGVVRTGPSHGSDRGRRAGGHHVQFVLIDDRWPVGSRPRGRDGRGSVGPDLLRHRGRHPVLPPAPFVARAEALVAGARRPDVRVCPMADPVSARPRC